MSELFRSPVPIFFNIIWRGGIVAVISWYNWVYMYIYIYRYIYIAVNLLWVGYEWIDQWDGGWCMSMIIWKESNMAVQYAEYRVFMISRWPCTALFPEFWRGCHGGSQSHHRFQYENGLVLDDFVIPSVQEPLFMTGWWFGTFYIFHMLGTISHLMYIFQRGWNHQPVNSDMTGLYTTQRIDTRMPWLTLRRKIVVSKLWRWVHATGRCEAIQQPNLGTRPYSLPICNYRYLISNA